MTRPLVDQIVAAVLYEGYLLYPYRPSSVKNRQRWTFGGVVPQAYSLAQRETEPWSVQTECLIQGHDRTALTVQVRFLHLLERREIGADDKNTPAWQEAVERDVRVPEMILGWLAEYPERLDFTFPASEVTTDFIRRHQAVHGTVECSARRVNDGFRVTVRIVNTTSLDAANQLSRDDAMMFSFVSTHTILSAREGRFISLLDPPEAWSEAAAGCRNIGTWPVLVGEPGQSDTMLSSPIILYDYPRVAPESPGDFFDVTEIDEMLALRIMTMTDDEKREMSAADARARALLQRTEGLPGDELLRLHGTVRGLRPIAGDERTDRRRLECVHLGPVELTRGDRVRLRPRGRADVFDLVLAGMTATIQAIEQDFEDRVHLAITVDDDPGQDFGTAGLPGHRFFFGLDEVEPLAGDAEGRS